jgi:1,4-alpha-glucan branching enzyme
MNSLTAEAYAIIAGRHSDPFHYLGPHVEGDATVIRVFLPDAEGVAVVDEHGQQSDLRRIHDVGLFEGRLADGSRHYRVRARYGERQVEIEDPYRFPPILSDFDLYLLGEGLHMHLYEKLGAHPMVLDGVPGMAFAVFAPSAKRVSVVGDFNVWNGRRHAMRVRGNGFWEIFVPEAKPNDKYKYEIIGGWPDAAVEFRSAGLRGRAAAADRFDRGRPEYSAATARCARERQRAE